MTIADLSSIRVNVWQDMAADLVGGKTVTPSAGASNNGPGADLGLVTTGAANSYAKATGYKPVFPTQGTIIYRVKFPAGCPGAKTPIYAGDINASTINFGVQGTNLIVQGNWAVGFRVDYTNQWEVSVATWGPAGVRGYQNGALTTTNAYTGSPGTPYYDLSFGALEYNGGIVQNIAMTMDFCAILNRQLSDAEVLDLSTNYTALWAAAGGGVNKRQAKLGAKRTGLACGGL